jgi:serine O-acetyltransferase
MRNAYLVLMKIIYLPYVLLRYTQMKSLIDREYRTFETMYFDDLEKIPGSLRFIYLIEKYPELISMLNFRLGKVGRVLARLYAGQKTLYIVTDEIGSNFKVWHGFSTIINATHIGNDCSIWQQVTIGNKDWGKLELKPYIKNNVQICAGAIVIGNITIEDNVTIGAGAVVTKSIPANSIAVGNPARIIPKV